MCKRDAQTPGDPWRWSPRFASGHPQIGGFQRRTHCGHHQTRFEVPRCIRPRRPRASPGDRGRTLYRKYPKPESHHECEKRSRRRRSVQGKIRGRSRGPRSAQSAAGATSGGSPGAYPDRQVRAHTTTVHRRNATVVAEARCPPPMRWCMNIADCFVISYAPNRARVRGRSCHAAVSAEGV